jgi:5-formyltetrahydrofolate cyclo-ligase
MAVPKMANIEPFYRLDDPARTTDADRATDSVPTVRIEEVEPIDIAICGSVAVNRTGARLGKGAGYADLELALLTEAGVVTTKTLIVTTVHAYQLIDDDIPEKGHDFRADIIVTPHETLYCPPWKRPTGLRWDDLDASKIAAIPILQARARERSSRLQKRPEGAGRRSDLG